MIEGQACPWVVMVGIYGSVCVNQDVSALCDTERGQGRALMVVVGRDLTATCIHKCTATAHVGG